MLVAACGGGSNRRTSPSPSAEVASTAPAGSDATLGLELPEGFRAEYFAQGLNSPTAMAFGPDGLLYLTQTNGRENARLGQVVVVEGRNVVPRALLSGLTKPTGLAWVGNDLYIVAGRDVLRSSLGEDGALSKPAAVVRELPYNGRSEGQIELLPDGRLLFEASGSLGDKESGVLLTMRPGDARPKVLATGLKNAYGYAVEPGRDAAAPEIYVTEIAEEQVDRQAPPDELNLIRSGEDYGWPRCYGARQVARDRGGSPEDCARTSPAVFDFPPQSTPVGLTYYARDDFPEGYRDVLYAAMWNGAPPTVERIQVARSGGEAQGMSSPFIEGMARPIDVLPHPDGGLLAADQETGVVYRVFAAEATSGP